jgi:Glycosyl transferase family 11
MIGVVSQGRMGNQMFQLAFVYCAAKKLNTSFFIYGAKSLHYFQCDDSHLSSNSSKIFKFILKNIFSKSQHKFQYRGRKRLFDELNQLLLFKHVISWSNKVGEENFQLKDYQDNTLYSGFFQSEKYFVEFTDQIRNLFSLKDIYRKAFEARSLPYRAEKYVAIHLRRSDYLDYGGDELGGVNMTLPVEYYHKCLALIDNLDNLPVVFVSDDIEFVKREFGVKSNYYFESNDEITDFQILLNASTVVTANSTFSWWAAWLNNRTDKVVFAPEYFLGFKIKKDYPGGIRVNNWNWINVGGGYE